MLHEMDSPYGLLPLKLSLITIRPLVWADFIQLDYHQSSAYYAHIYWTINYEAYNNGDKDRLTALKVSVTNKSWVIKSLKSTELLIHQSGHYIIGCLCALEFMKAINVQRKSNCSDQTKKIFNSVLRKWCDLEKQYDEDTQHYMNRDKQKEWDEYLSGQLFKYMDVFDCADIE